MPALIERHRSDVSATEQLRRERNSDGSSKDVSLTRNSIGAASDSDENGPDENPDGVMSSAEKQKRIMAPRRKFVWNPHLR